jgi:hypothetical protein
MSAETDYNKMVASGVKQVWCTTWTFTVNTGRRLKILGRHALACKQQGDIKKATRELGEKTLQALARGEANPLTDPEVNTAVQKIQELKELKEKNYQEIAAIRERIGSSCVIATPDQPGGVEENPPVP